MLLLFRLNLPQGTPQTLPAGGAADYGGSKKRRRVVVGGKHYRVTPDELRQLLEVEAEARQPLVVAQQVAKPKAVEAKIYTEAYKPDDALMRQIAIDLAEEDEMEDILMMLL